MSIEVIVQMCFSMKYVENQCKDKVTYSEDVFLNEICRKSDNKVTFKNSTRMSEIVRPSTFKCC